MAIKYTWTTVTSSTISEHIMLYPLHEDSRFRVYFSQEDRYRIEAELEETGKSKAVDKFGRECTFKKIMY